VTIVLSHLVPSASDTLALSPLERIQFLYCARWIGYPRANTILAHLEFLLQVNKSRRGNVLLIAEPGNGKTTLFEEFKNLHPPVIPLTGDPYIPAIHIDMPPDASEGRFWGAVLRGMRVAFREGDTAARKSAMAIDCLRALRVRMLVIDEFHNALHGSARDTRQFMAVLKNLMNCLSIPVVLAGTRPAVTALNTDSQLTTRFELFSLPPWTLNQDFLRFLASLERLLPLAEPSGLATRELATEIFQSSDRTVGGICSRVTDAAVLAIRSGKERITPAILKEARHNSLEALSQSLHEV
jgi:Bacterial TniB protein